MTILWTAQYRYPGICRFDISMKCKPKTLGIAFQPTWDLVMNHKKGIITDAEYTTAYRIRMETSLITNKPYWDVLLGHEHLVLVCFCAAGSFCHRLLLKDFLIEKFPQNFEYIRELTPNEKGEWV